MRIYLKDQNYNFKKHLELLKSKAVMYYEKSQLIEKSTTINIDTTKTLDQLNLDFLFNYQIFPDNIMTYILQWKEEGRAMKIGDTIAQQVYIPPTKTFSQKIIFGVRINAIFDEANRKGFSYETLNAHVEKGVSIFTVEQIDNQIFFKIQTYSKPGNILTKILGPFFSIPYQTFCTKTALHNVKGQLESQ
jgi:hypothetical protein